MTDRIDAMIAALIEQDEALEADNIEKGWARSPHLDIAVFLKKHGLTPPPATTGLRFGCHLVECKNCAPWCVYTSDYGHYLVDDGTWWTWDGRKEVDPSNAGIFDTRDAALSALASAPAPPGWVEPQSDKPRRYGARFIEHTLPHNKGTGYIRSADGQHELYGSGFGEARWTDEPESGGTFSEGEVDAWLARAEPPPGWVEPNPTVKPALTVEAGRERWFRDEVGTVRKYPQSVAVFVGKDPMRSESKMEWCIAQGHTELDPATGRPLSAPAPEKGEGDGKPEDAPADRTRLTLYPAKMCAATEAAFNWISSHDGGAHGALFTRALSDACAEYAAHATAALARERDALREELDSARADVEAQRTRAHANYKAYSDADRALTATINERDSHAEMLDSFVKAVGGIKTCGEHSNLNCPWGRALDLVRGVFGPKTRPKPTTSPKPAPPTPQPQRWFVVKDIDHRKGTHQCWRFNADCSGGRFWWRGKDHAPSRPTLAECIASKSHVEISPTTGEPIGKKRAKVKAKAATRKKARGK